MIEANNISTFVTSKILNTPTNSPLFQSIYRMIQAKNITEDFTVDTANKTVVFNGTKVNLQKKKKIFEVFCNFYGPSNHVLDRTTLINRIYLKNQNRVPSLRQSGCHSHNIVKLISRARKIAKKNFNNKHLNKLDWFPYDPYSKTWMLNRLQPTPNALNHS
tara:strand:+ start:1330 stop:1812 length:483 start_codon:yes stop_codon:yes gene_type:complete